MSELYDEALATVGETLRAWDPARAVELSARIGTAALRNPDDPNNAFLARLGWPTSRDPWASVAIKANFPRQRLENGQGYLGLTFTYNEAVPDMNSSITTDLEIRYGIGGSGLLEPMDAGLTETVETLAGGIEPVWSPASSEAAAFILAKFGIAEV